MRKGKTKITARKIDKMNMITDQEKLSKAARVISDHLDGNKQSDAKLFVTGSGMLLIVARQFPKAFRKEICEIGLADTQFKFTNNMIVKDLPAHKQGLRIGIPV